MIQQIKSEFERRMKDECLFRIQRCLDSLEETSVWYSPNAQVNSAANLVLHLSGNIRQYIFTTFGKQDDIRQRSLEFSSLKSHNIAQLKKLIEETILEAVDIIHRQEEQNFLDEYDVQCFKENGIGILIHVIEHTSYHTGQITQMTKWLKNIDTKYYPDLDLDKTK